MKEARREGHKKVSSGCEEGRRQGGKVMRSSKGGEEEEVRNEGGEEGR